ncbi:hypothetical protein SUGI_0705670 [Cryptomeria japonica]|nr:hypothetical protein SUGI_0705670 [Cryptomeria japonica]
MATASFDSYKSQPSLVTEGRQRQFLDQRLKVVSMAPSGLMLEGIKKILGAEFMIEEDRHTDRHFVKICSFSS